MQDISTPFRTPIDVRFGSVDDYEMIDTDTALAFGSKWVDAWNAHDLDAVLRHYDDDVVFTSPYVVALGFDPSGTLRGLHTLRRYFAAGLSHFPDLRFELHGVLAGVDSVTVVYTSVRGQQAAEVMALRDGLAVQVCCHYGSLNR
jgi:ketosteroid isomerase-like protein